MTQYLSVNMTLSNFQINKLKSATKKPTDAALILSSNMIGNTETNFPQNLLINGWQS